MENLRFFHGVIFSLIRREVPAMDDIEFEQLDRLSGGKLRHLLVGSPSGYSWTDQVIKITNRFFSKSISLLCFGQCLNTE